MAIRDADEARDAINKRIDDLKESNSQLDYLLYGLIGYSEDKLEGITDIIGRLGEIQKKVAEMKEQIDGLETAYSEQEDENDPYGLPDDFIDSLD